MLLFLIITLCISLTTAKHVDMVDKEVEFLEDNGQVLFNQDRYTVRVTKMIMTAGIIEELVTWKDKTLSRVHYNEGAVKYIANTTGFKSDWWEYKLYHRTYLNGSLYNVCEFKKNKVSLIDVLEILRNEAFEYVGLENVTYVKTKKYDSKRTIDDFSIKKTCWFMDSDSVPVKYEYIKFNHDLGSVVEHEVWYFTDYSTEFDDSVFDVTDFTDNNCIQKKDTHKPYSEKVTTEHKSVSPENENYEHLFNHFKTQYERKYADEKEHSFRKYIFIENMKLISKVNSMNLTYKLTVTQFADKTIEEMETEYTGLLKRTEGKVGNVPFPYSEAELTSIVKDLPEEYDLRSLGLVSSVKNDKYCEAFWAFAATAVVEGALAKVNGGRVLSLSTQALVDCAWGYAAPGLDEGNHYMAYEWMMQYGLPTVEDYGLYTGREGICHIANVTRKYPIKGYTDVTRGSNNALKAALVYHGPLFVYIKATEKFKLYSRGIYFEKACNSTTYTHHAATLIGYGVEHGDLYWVLKNSWGDVWGEAGYVRISAKCECTLIPSYVVF